MFYMPLRLTVKPLKRRPAYSTKHALQVGLETTELSRIFNERKCDLIGAHFDSLSMSVINAEESKKSDARKIERLQCALGC